MTKLEDWDLRHLRYVGGKTFCGADSEAPPWSVKLDQTNCADCLQEYMARFHMMLHPEARARCLERFAEIAEERCGMAEAAGEGATVKE
jgi:hypothetical protein